MDNNGMALAEIYFVSIIPFNHYNIIFLIQMSTTAHYFEFKLNYFIINLIEEHLI